MLVEIRCITYPPLFGAPVGRNQLRILLRFFGVRKLESLGIVCMILGLAVLVEHRNTDL